MPCRFTVAGSGEFPVDMLRYDRCFPNSTEDALAILTPEKREDYTKIREVALCSTRQAAPTAGRWNSFCWGVVKVDGQ